MGIRKMIAVFKLNSLQIYAWQKLYQIESYVGCYQNLKKTTTDDKKASKEA
ncbi:hypothetical protein SDC49_05090 [Lactobacillus sp. R2/2]|nr:hypothetical protein [Lactobacillus sp. R2/2]